MSTPPPDPLQAEARLAPVAPGERIELLDIFRGFALLGVLIANMRGFNGPMAAYFDHTLMWQDTVSVVTQVLIDLFVSMKFITIFSFLFGIGFAIQLERAATRPAGFLLRRFGFLAALGLVHLYLIWWGDILFAYALFGFALLLFRCRSQKALLRWAAAMYFWPLVPFGIGVAASLLVPNFPETPRYTPAQLAALIQTYATGNYADILVARIREANQAMIFIPVAGPRSLGLFLFGLWVWRQGIIQNITAYLDRLPTWRTWGFAIGFPLMAAAEAVNLIFKPNPVGPSIPGYAYFVLVSLAVPGISLGYLVTIARLTAAPVWQARLRAFAAVGRMALTNYLTQSVVCTLLFYGYGLGFFGRVAPLPGLGISLALFAAQMVLSQQWFLHFEQGPMEALWRRVTYAGGQEGSRHDTVAEPAPAEETQ